MIDWLLGGTLGASGHLEWTAPTWIVTLAAAAALIAFLAAQRGLRPWQSRVVESALWLLALAGVVVVTARPLWVEEQGHREPGRVAVLVDASASMGVLEHGAPRSEAVAGVLASLAGDDVDLYHFGGELGFGPPSRFDLPGTDLERALEQLGDRVAGERLAGVVVITDGLDREALRRRFGKEDNPVPPALPGPLTVFQIGEVSALRDLSVRFVDGGGYAYVHAAASIHAELLGVGFEGTEVTAELLRDDAVVSTRTVTLDAEGVGQVTFTVEPDVAGRFTYAVRVPVYEGDAVPSNNLLPVVMRVVRDRVRVLQVAGAPSWDVKFLRRFLKGDPSVDLVSFFILRTARDISRPFRDDELSLIQFPYQELFTEDLLTFDLVIFQNFDHRPYFDGRSDQLLKNLRDFVEKDGHGFVMLGGDRSFDLGAYGGTPLGEILPVGVATEPTPADEAPFRPRLTAAGARHPVTRLVSDAAENAAWWERLHTLDGTNRVLAAQPGATVLLEHPSLEAGGRPLPVLAVREVGNGRTMTLTADSSWRWSLSEAAVGRGNQAYLRFWKGAIRWLIGEPSTRRVSVETPRENYAVGEEVRVVVSVRDAAFAPLAGATAAVSVTVDGRPTTYEAVSDADGEAVLRLPAERRGAHRVGVEVKKGDQVIGEAETVYAVTTRDPELDEVVPDVRFLRWLAERTEGRYYGAGELGPILRDPDAGRTVFERTEVAIWRAPLLVLLVLLAAGGAWIVRRRSGLR